jgi:hypothetical protein
MASESDSLVLAARIVDEFSKPLAHLKRSLRSIAADSSQFHKTSIAQARDHAIAFHDLKRSLTEVGDHVRGILTPAKTGLGVG